MFNPIPKPVKKKKSKYKADERMKRWHRAVCKRENYKCQGSGRVYSDPSCFDEEGNNIYLCGHHDKTKAAFPELKYHLDNGKCTDKESHTKHHNGELQYSENRVITGEIIY